MNTAFGDVLFEETFFLKAVEFYVCLFPKGEFLRTHRVGPFGLNGFLHLGLLFGFFYPYKPWPLSSRCGWWWGVFLGENFTFSNFFGSCLRSIWALFKAFNAYLRVYLQVERLINDSKNRDFWSKICPV